MNKTVAIEKKEKTFFLFSLILIGIIFCSSLGFIIYSNINNNQGRYAQIWQNETLIRTISLSDYETLYEFTIKNQEHYNIIQIQDNKIRIIDADCPDKLCCKTGFISNSYIPIICLPNKLIIKITDNNSSPSTIDSISY